MTVTPDWLALPPELVRLCFQQMAAAVNAGGGASVREAAALLAAASCCRAWRRAALEELRLRLRLESAAELGHPLLLALPCRELRLPPALDDYLAPAQRAAAEAAMVRLLRPRTAEACVLPA